MPDPKAGPLPQTLEDWLAYLEALHPAEIELGLERVASVYHRLGLPPLAKKVVVVAGTNGKGSCVRAMETLTLAQGYSVASYTSPHILSYNERVRLMGRNASNEQLCDAFARVENARAGVPLTYFEMGTLAAMVLMSSYDLDFAFLEIGLGGRFDAVNIIDSDVAIITSIDLDHTDWLGDDRDTIAREKAGVARAGKPLICADSAPPPSLITTLQQLDAKALFIGRDFSCVDLAGRLSIYLRQEQQGQGALQLEDVPIPSLPLPSVLAALQALSLLGVSLPARVVRESLQSLALTGRYQVQRIEGKKVILDVAHNPAAARHLAERLAAEKGPLVCVAALMADKDAEGFVTALAGVIDHWSLGTLIDNKRAMAAEDLADLLYTHSCPVSCNGTVEEAVDSALAMVPDEGAVVVCGSFFTVAAALKQMEKRNGL